MTATGWRRVQVELSRAEDAPRDRARPARLAAAEDAAEAVAWSRTARCPTCLGPAAVTAAGTVRLTHSPACPRRRRPGGPAGAEG